MLDPPQATAWEERPCEDTQEGSEERKKAVPKDGKKTRARVARAQTTQTTKRSKGVMGSARGGPSGRPVKALRAATQRRGSTTATMPSRRWNSGVRFPRDEPEKHQPTEPKKKKGDEVGVC